MERLNRVVRGDKIEDVYGPSYQVGDIAADVCAAWPLPSSAPHWAETLTEAERIPLRQLCAKIEAPAPPAPETAGSETERIAAAFHKTYEEFAPVFGYSTRAESAVPWEQVPPENRKLMLAVVSVLINEGVISSGRSLSDTPVTATPDEPLFHRGDMPDPEAEADPELQDLETVCAWCGKEHHRCGADRDCQCARHIDGEGNSRCSAAYPEGHPRRPSAPAPTKALRKCTNCQSEFRGEGDVRCPYCNRLSPASRGPLPVEGEARTRCPNPNCENGIIKGTNGVGCAICEAPTARTHVEVQRVELNITPEIVALLDHQDAEVARLREQVLEYTRRNLTLTARNDEVGAALSRLRAENERLTRDLAGEWYTTIAAHRKEQERIIATLRAQVENLLTPEQADYLLTARQNKQWAGAATKSNWPKWVKDANAALDNALRRIAGSQP